MNRGTEPTNSGAQPDAGQSAVGLFREAAQGRAIRAGLGLIVEYAMFASAVGLAVALFATRVPLRAADSAFGLRVRERFVNLLARISPG